MSASGPTLDQFNLVVSNMEASVAFYRLLGLTIPDTRPEWQEHHRSASLGGGIDLDLDSAEFAATWNRGWPGRAAGGMGVLGLRVSSRELVDETATRVAEGGHHIQQPPYDAFWGARYTVVEDPDGNAVGLMSPVDAASRTTPQPPPSR